MFNLRDNGYGGQRTVRENYGSNSQRCETVIDLHSKIDSWLENENAITV